LPITRAFLQPLLSGPIGSLGGWLYRLLRPLPHFLGRLQAVRLFFALLAHELAHDMRARFFASIATADVNELEARTLVRRSFTVHGDGGIAGEDYCWSCLTGPTETFPMSLALSDNGIVLTAALRSNICTRLFTPKVAVIIIKLWESACFRSLHGRGCHTAGTRGNGFLLLAASVQRH
jgi:hypothetical protein